MGRTIISLALAILEVQMSFKGFQKSVIRAPQLVKQHFNIGEQTKDAVYIDSERRFSELEKETEKLRSESKKYFDAINGMMNHQIEFSQAIAEIYKPISGRVSDPDSTIPEGNPEGIRACEEYEAICRDLLATLQPELEMIETRVIRPAQELLEIIKVIRKSATKRQHKQLDYDRHRATLKKLQDLKEELPKLFALEREFIRPLFQSFYYMQLNVFYTLHEKMQGCDIGYFNLQLDVEEGFEAARGDIQERAEALTIVKFKTTGAKRPPGRLGPGSKLALEGKSSPKLIGAAPKRQSMTASTEEENPPPPYSSNSLSPTYGGDEKTSVVRANSTASSPSWGSAAKAKGPAPPPPKPKPSRLSGAPAAETVTALYDYEAQAEGDLSFTTGDVIEIVTRTNNENEWWIGKVKGKQGQFPGNYVKIN